MGLCSITRMVQLRVLGLLYSFFHPLLISLIFYLIIIASVALVLRFETKALLTLGGASTTQPHRHPYSPSLVVLFQHRQ